MGNYGGGPSLNRLTDSVRDDIQQVGQAGHDLLATNRLGDPDQVRDLGKAGLVVAGLVATGGAIGAYGTEPTAADLAATEGASAVNAASDTEFTDSLIASTQPEAVSSVGSYTIPDASEVSSVYSQGADVGYGSYSDSFIPSNEPSLYESAYGSSDPLADYQAGGQVGVTDPAASQMATAKQTALNPIAQAALGAGAGVAANAITSLFTPKSVPQQGGPIAAPKSAAPSTSVNVTSPNAAPGALANIDPKTLAMGAAALIGLYVITSARKAV